MKPTLTVAIPTWNNSQQLSDCLSTLIGYTKFPLKIVVVDNGGSKDLEESVREWPRNVEYINPGSNLGWMGGVNYALESCDTPLFCMMNDDVVFLPGDREFWQKLTSQFDDPEVGLVAPASDFVAGTQSITYLTQLTYNVTVVMGVCLVIKTAFFKELGGLDESLPGGDDLDLCVRVRKAGKHVRVNKAAFLHHIGQQSGRRKHGDYYDSAGHQEKTKNAIAAKYGLREWANVHAFSIEDPVKEKVLI